MDNFTSRFICLKFSIILQIQGLGPGFKLFLTLQTTAPDTPSKNLLITFSADHKLYKIAQPYIEVIYQIDNFQGKFCGVVGTE